MTENEVDIVDLLVQHELAVGELYHKFSGRYRYHADFWEKLSSDEKKHADWLGRLREKSVINRWLLESAGLKEPALRASISYVRDQERKAEKVHLNIIQALSIARDLENALLEKQFDRTRDIAPAKYRALFTRLAEETEKHRDSITGLLKILKEKRI
ncbi:MAG: hypothetical protein GF417_03325 [Candidatus Latescibacteria bacterium]|nr:hypothetical protein [bacterium]MBD3423459.1 hypothetical protein [Candidatus Latescibacterota bacterium]